MSYARKLRIVGALLASSVCVPTIAQEQQASSPGTTLDEAEVTQVIALSRSMVDLYALKAAAIVAPQVCTNFDPQALAILNDPQNISTAFTFAINTIIDASPLSASKARQLVHDLDRRVAGSAQRILIEWPTFSSDRRAVLCGTAQAFALSFLQHRIEIESLLRAHHWEQR